MTTQPQKDFVVDFSPSPDLYDAKKLKELLLRVFDGNRWDSDNQIIDLESFESNPEDFFSEPVQALLEWGSLFGFSFVTLALSDSPEKCDPSVRTAIQRLVKKMQRSMNRRHLLYAAYVLLLFSVAINPNSEDESDQIRRVGCRQSATLLAGSVVGRSAVAEWIDVREASLRQLID